MTAPTRRAALTALASVPALALPAIATAAVAAPDADSELIALAAEIERLCALSDDIYAKRVDPFQETFQSLIDDALPAVKRNPAGWREHSAKAWDYSREIGRDAGIQEAGEVDERADRIWKRMMEIPAAGQAGRAAKVRALLTHVCSSEWRGPTEPLDWEIQETRALLGQFAGMTEEALAAI